MTENKLPETKLKERLIDDSSFGRGYKDAKFVETKRKERIKKRYEKQRKVADEFRNLAEKLSRYSKAKKKK